MRTHIRLRHAAVLAAGLLVAGCAGTREEPPPEASSPVDDAEPSDESALAEEPEREAGAEDADAGHDTMEDDVHTWEAIGEPADAGDATRAVEIEAFDMGFDPESVTVDAGDVVTFVVTNTGEAVHEFTLGDAAMQQEHADEMADMDAAMAHDDPNSISLAAGETRELTWRFGEAGTLEYACHEPGHYEAGMRGELAVG